MRTATKGRHKRRPEPGPLTLGEAGVPEMTVHDPMEIPLAGSLQRWSFVDWEDVHRAILSGKAVAIAAIQDEVDAVLRYLRTYTDEEADSSVPLRTTYCPATQRLWIWSGLICFGPTRNAG